MEKALYYIHQLYIFLEIFGYFTYKSMRDQKYEYACYKDQMGVHPPRILSEKPSKRPWKKRMIHTILTNKPKNIDMNFF